MARPREILTLEDLKSRLLARTDIRMDGCWMWLGAWSDSGYGSMFFAQRQLSAHVASYMTHIGPIPQGLWVLHSCDNKWCVNPKHLFLGTVQDNVDDSVAKGRHVRGERQGSSKLKEEDVRNIRKLIAEGYSDKEIAGDYGVSDTAIHWIKTGQNWSWLS